MTILDGVNRQSSVSDRVPMPVDIVSDTAYVNSISGESVQLYYFSNAYLTTGTAGTTNAATWAALTSTSTFQIDVNGKTYVINPDFTGDSDMDAVAASIQTALRAKTGILLTCTQGTNIFTITTAKDESGEGMANSISVLSNPSSNTGTNIAGATWMNGLYGTGVVTPATATTDAGQAAGTVVVAKLKYSGILDHVGAMIGNDKDTSLAWTTNTVLPTKYRKELPKFAIEEITSKELVDIAYTVAKNFTTNGEWGLDHRTGLLVGRKATTGTSDTAAYKVQTQTTGGGTSIADSINVAKVGDVAVVKDDAAYAPATHYPNPIAAVADDASVDSVDEGDLGYLRMGLDRVLYTQGAVAHDAADSGNPLKIGGKASTAKPTAVSNADRVNAYFDEYGRLHTIDEGGSSTLPATHRSPQDFTVAYTSNVTVTVTGAPFTVATANCYIAYIYYKPTAGTWQPPLVNGVNGVSITSAANVITVAGAGTPFAASDTYLVGIVYQEKAYTKATDSDRTGEINPIDEHYEESELVDTTNLAATTHYFPSSTGLAMGNKNNITSQFGLTDADGTLTLTVQAKIDDSTDWIDITKAGYELSANSAGNASYTNAYVGATTGAGILAFDDLHVRNVRFALVASGATNAVQLHIKTTAV